MNGKNLANTLDQMTTQGELYEKLDSRKVRCLACGHRCVIFEGQCPRCQTAIPGIWWPNEDARRQGASMFAHRIARVF